MNALDWLYQTQLFGVKLGLDNMRRLLQETLPSHPPERPPVVFHVAGTNGKGSVCAYLDSICRAHGWRSGLFTSPHLIDFRERMRVNGQLIQPDPVERILNDIRSRVHAWEPHPSFFEIALALALIWFHEQQVEVIVLETGLGGRLDATNAVDHTDVSIITSIDLDHMSILGSDLPSIAREKAGIFRRGTPAVCAPQTSEVLTTLQEIAQERGAPFFSVDAPIDRSIQLPLLGQHQRINAAVAIAGLRQAPLKINETAIRRGLETASWPARFQCFGEDGRIILDAAHNESGAIALAETWRECYGDEKATLIYGCAKDKDLQAVIRALLPICDRVILPQIRSPRCLSPEDLMPAFTAISQRSTTEDFQTAFLEGQQSPERILIAGSLFLAGEALNYLTNQEADFRPSSQ